jgi:hypothetical protein
MKSNIKRDYHSKAQNKDSSRMNKYVEKTKLKHNDEIVKVNQERLRKLEREHIRNDNVAPALHAS